MDRQNKDPAAGELNPLGNQISMRKIIDEAKSILSDHPNAKFEIGDDFIHVLPGDDTGFNFALTLEQESITLYYGQWHHPFDDNRESALEIFEKCISGKAQLVEVKKLGLPCLGHLEIFNGANDKPVDNIIMGTIFQLIFFFIPGKEDKYINHY